MTPEIKESALRPRYVLTALLILVAYLCLSMGMVLTAMPESDEARCADPAYNLSHKGAMASTLFEPKDKPTLHTYWQTPLFFVITALWFRIVDFGVVQVRLVSVFFGLVCIVSWAMIVRYLQKSTAAALLAGGLVAADYFFVNGASHGRMDVMCAGFGAAGIAVYLNWREKSLARAVFWSHALATAAIFAHPTGVIYSSGLALILLWWDWRKISVRLVILVAAPYLVGLAAWGAYILRDPENFLPQFMGNVNMNKEAFAKVKPRFPLIESVRQELMFRYVGPFGLGPGVGAVNRLKAVILTAYLTGVLGILVSGKLRKQRTLLILSLLFLLNFAVITFIAPSKYAYYLPHTTTVMAACLSVFLFRFSSSTRRKWLVAVPVVAAVLMIQVLGTAYRIRQNLYANSYLPTVNAILQHSQPNAKVIGPGELWFGLESRRELLHDLDFGYQLRNRPDVFVMDALYRMMHQKAKLQNPAAYEYVEALIARSRMVYQDSFFQVFVPNP